MTRKSDEHQRTELDSTWKWFEYHAQQRLTGFHYFLIIVGLIAVAFAQAIDKDLEGFGTIVGALGVLVSVGFWMLDVRNEELVRSGQVALETLQKGFDAQLARDSRERTNLVEVLGVGPVGGRLGRWVDRAATDEDRLRRASVFTHRFWFRTIELSVSVAFLAATFWAAVGFPGS
jgi:hypothetical protein